MKAKEALRLAGGGERRAACQETAAHERGKLIGDHREGRGELDCGRRQKLSARYRCRRGRAHWCSLFLVVFQRFKRIRCYAGAGISDIPYS